MDCLDIQTVVGCRKNAGGAVVGNVLIHTEYRKNTSGNPVVHAVRYTNAAGAPILLVAGETVAPGECPAAVAPPPALQARRILAGARNYASGSFSVTHDPNGNGFSFTPNGSGTLDSFTIQVTQSGGTPSSADRVRIRFSALGDEIFLVKGQTFTWSTTQDDYLNADFIDEDIRVDAEGNSAFIASQTRKQ